MSSSLIEFGLSAIVIIIAGTYLSRFADEIAEKTGLGRLLIGSVLLAGATSLPELTVDISAVRSGMADLAVGDLMGSSLANLMILAVLDLIAQTPGTMLSIRSARHALSGNVSAALAAIVAIGLLAQPVLGQGEFLGISNGLWFVLFGYIFGVRLIYLDQAAHRVKGEPVDQATEDGTPGAWGKSALGFAIAALVIVLAGPSLAHAAGQIADQSGLGKTFVGTTLVALSTSLPELVTSLAALRMNSHDLVIGNVFGSNAFNMIILLPIDFMHSGPILSAVSSSHAVTCIASILVTMIVVLGQLYQVERKRPLIDPDAILAIIAIIGSLWIVYRLG